jgi:hypothetical protein
MFRRAETAKERMLMRIVERQERQIRDLIDRLMYVRGSPWVPPPADLAGPGGPGPVEQFVSALDVLPEEWG